MEDLSRLLTPRSRPHYVTQEQIDTVHPLTADRYFDTYEAAAILVGERHRKSELVDLVNYLLIKAQR